MRLSLSTLTCLLCCPCFGLVCAAVLRGKLGEYRAWFSTSFLGFWLLKFLILSDYPHGTVRVLLAFMFSRAALCLSGSKGPVKMGSRTSTHPVAVLPSSDCCKQSSSVSSLWCLSVDCFKRNLWIYQDIFMGKFFCHKSFHPTWI